MLYKMSKKREQEQLKLHAAAAPPSQQPHGTNWGAVAGGAAALGAVGYGAHALASHSTAKPSSSTGDVPWSALRDWRHIAALLASCVIDQHLYPFYAWHQIATMSQQIAEAGVLYSCAEVRSR
jgi:hypothetical protein